MAGIVAVRISQDELAKINTFDRAGIASTIVTVPIVRLRVKLITQRISTLRDLLAKDKKTAEELETLIAPTKRL